MDTITLRWEAEGPMWHIDDDEFHLVSTTPQQAEELARMGLLDAEEFVLAAALAVSGSLDESMKGQLGLTNDADIPEISG